LKAIEKRLRSFHATLAMRLQSDCKVTARRLCSTLKAIEKRLQSDRAAIP
jgi:hypothetical protein